VRFLRFFDIVSIADRIDMNPAVFDDPTQEARCIVLRDRILNDSKVQAFLRRLRASRLALVLFGGGGKGAYEAGCLLALFDAGIRNFCVFAGTSVGALNAALGFSLFHTGERQSAVKLWSTISPWKVLTVNPLRILLSVPVRLLMHISAIPIYIIARGMHFAERFIGRSWVVLVLQSPQLAAIMLLLVTVPFGSAGFWLMSGRPPNVWQLLVEGFSVLILYGLIGILRPLIETYLSVLNNKPLRDIIISSVEIGVLRNADTPIYITIVSDVEYWDPFEEGSDPAISETAWRKEEAASYFKLNDSENDQAALILLMQSAAIPELFPQRRVLGQRSVDGGTQDNTPILPVLAHRPDTIIVVYLDHTHAVNNNLREDEQLRTWWMLEHYMWTIQSRDSASKVRREYLEKYGAIDSVKERPIMLSNTPPFEDKVFVPIVPSQNLGGLVFGTMNFSAEKSCRLISVGYCDTLLRLEHEAQLLAASAQSQQNS
jgi:predicted acylesterase/phospholipase RssA